MLNNQRQVYPVLGRYFQGKNLLINKTFFRKDYFIKMNREYAKKYFKKNLYYMSFSKL